MTMTDTVTTRFEPDDHPVLFGVETAYADLVSPDGVTHDSVNCKLTGFSDGVYEIRCSVRCPQCDFNYLVGTYLSTTDLRLTEIRGRLIEQGPCQRCERVNSGEVKELEARLRRARNWERKLAEVLTGPTGIKPTVESHRGGYSVTKGDFLPIYGTGRRVYPTWLQQNDPETLRALSNLVEQLEAIGKASGKEHVVELVPHPRLPFIGVSFEITPVEFHALLGTSQLQALKDHRKRMQTVKRRQRSTS